MLFMHNGVSAYVRVLEEDDDVCLEHPELAGHWYVSSLARTTPERGHASALMRKLLNAASQAGVRVALMPIAQPSPETLSQAQLEAFYERHGFTRADTGYFIHQ